MRFYTYAFVVVFYCLSAFASATEVSVKASVDSLYEYSNGYKWVSMTVESGDMASPGSRVYAYVPNTVSIHEGSLEVGNTVWVQGTDFNDYGMYIYPVTKVRNNKPTFEGEIYNIHYRRRHTLLFLTNLSNHPESSMSSAYVRVCSEDNMDSSCSEDVDYDALQVGKKITATGSIYASSTFHYKSYYIYETESLIENNSTVTEFEVNGGATPIQDIHEIRYVFSRDLANPWDTRLYLSSPGPDGNWDISPGGDDVYLELGLAEINYDYVSRTMIWNVGGWDLPSGTYSVMLTSDDGIESRDGDLLNGVGYDQRDVVVESDNPIVTLFEVNGGATPIQDIHEIRYVFSRDLANPWDTRLYLSSPGPDGNWDIGSGGDDVYLELGPGENNYDYVSRTMIWNVGGWDLPSGTYSVMLTSDDGIESRDGDLLNGEGYDHRDVVIESDNPIVTLFEVNGGATPIQDIHEIRYVFSRDLANPWDTRLYLSSPGPDGNWDISPGGDDVYLELGPGENNYDYVSRTMIWNVGGWDLPSGTYSVMLTSDDGIESRDGDLLNGVGYDQRDVVVESDNPIVTLFEVNGGATPIQDIHEIRYVFSRDLANPWDTRLYLSSPGPDGNWDISPGGDDVYLELGPGENNYDYVSRTMIWNVGGWDLPSGTYSVMLTSDDGIESRDGDLLNGEGYDQRDVVVESDNPIVTLFEVNGGATPIQDIHEIRYVFSRELANPWDTRLYLSSPGPDGSWDISSGGDDVYFELGPAEINYDYLSRTMIWNVGGYALPSGTYSVMLTSDDGIESRDGDLLNGDGYDRRDLIVESNDSAAAHQVFVTSGTYNGNLGGLEGADEICQQEANHLGGTWKAILSDPYEPGHAGVHVPVTGEVHNMRGELVAYDEADLWDGGIEHQIAYDSHGDEVIGQVWTATQPNGTRYSIAAINHYCNNWHQASSAQFTGIGNNDPSTPSGWISQGQAYCNTYKHLYCISQ